MEFKNITITTVKTPLLDEISVLSCLSAEMIVLFSEPPFWIYNFRFHLALSLIAPLSKWPAS